MIYVIYSTVKYASNHHAPNAQYQYGHTKSYCHRTPKCVKCAGSHQTLHCQRKNISDDVKCVLCSGNHPANYKGCAVYQDLRKSKYPQPKIQNDPPRLEKRPNITSNLAESYADKLKQNQAISNNATNSSPSDLNNMMQMLQQIMQQLMTLTNLLVNIMPKTAQSLMP